MHAVHRMDTITFLTTISTFLKLVEPAVPAILAPVALVPVELEAPARLAIVAVPARLAIVAVPVALAIVAAPVIKIENL